MSTATITDLSIETNEAPDRLTETLEEKLSHPQRRRTSICTAEQVKVFKGHWLTTADAGRQAHVSGRDSDSLTKPDSLRDAARSRSGRRSVALADFGGKLPAKPGYLGGLRKATAAFFAGFFEGNGKPSWSAALPGGYAVSPFLKDGGCVFSRDTRWAVRAGARLYPPLSCAPSIFSACSRVPNHNNAIRKWTLGGTEEAAAARDWFWRWCGRMRNFVGNPNTRRPLKMRYHSEKIGESDPVPLKRAISSLAGVRALGMVT